MIDEFQLYRDPYLTDVITECYGRTPLHIAVTDKRKDVVNCFIDFRGRQQDCMYLGVNSPWENFKSPCVHHQSRMFFTDGTIARSCQSHIKRTWDSRTRKSTRFDCLFLAKIPRKFIIQPINLTLCQQHRLLLVLVLECKSPQCCSQVARFFHVL